MDHSPQKKKKTKFANLVCKYGGKIIHTTKGWLVRKLITKNKTKFDDLLLRKGWGRVCNKCNMALVPNSRTCPPSKGKEMG
jgi:hypothetical protein